MIGRAGELAAAGALLDGGARVVTVWGPPGVGKTAVFEALSAARGAPAVRLRSGGGVDGLHASVAAALCPGRPTPDDATLTGRLLALDGVELATEAVVRELGRWLEQAPGLQLLLAGRRLTRLPEERPVALPPLGRADALALLVREIGRRHPAFAPGPDELGSLEGLVDALEGLPLAIELAAARWELLGTDGLRARLGDPLELLTRRGVDPPRRLALRHAIGHSWELLAADERETLAAVAVFEGPFDLALAEGVAGAGALDALESLRDAALVQLPRPGRFSLLQVVRAFAREQGSAERRSALDEAHLATITQRVDAGGWVSLDDLHAACARAAERGDPRADRLAAGLGAAAPGGFLALLDQVVRATPTAAALRARGRALRLHGRTDDAERDFRAALDSASTAGVRGPLMRELGVLYHGSRRMDDAREWYERALVAHREANDPGAEAITIGNLGALDHDACRYEDAEVRYATALAGLRAAGDRRTEAVFVANHAVLLQEQGQLGAAETAYRRALALHESENDPRMSAITLGNLGLLLHELGRLDEALALHRSAAAQIATVADRVSEALGAARLGAALAATGDSVAAGVELDRAARAAACDPLTAGVVELFRGFVDHARGRVAERDRRLAEGRPFIELSGDARVAARLLRAMAGERPDPLEVDDDGFVFAAVRCDLSRHQSCRRMFHALVDARRTRPGAGLTLEALFAAGWPGERIGRESMQNRVHVNLARLRTSGLKPLLLRDDAGWFLDPATPLR
ncbi:MAG: tetratricopeptide repeat protein [Myxococcota bacterium]